MNDNNQSNNYSDYDEIDLRDIFKALGKWKWTITGVTLGAMLLAGIISFFILTPIYEARTVITGVQLQDLSANNPTNYILKEEQEYHSIKEDTITMPITSIGSENYIELLKSPWILNKTIYKLKLDMTPGSLGSIIKAEQPEGATSIEIKVSHQDPVLATNIANTLVEQLQIRIKNVEGQQVDRIYHVLEKQQSDAQRDLDKAINKYAEFHNNSSTESIAGRIEATKLQNTINRRSDVLDLLNTKILELNLTRSFIENEDSITVLSQATEPEYPVKPNKKLNVAIAGVLALMLSVFGVFLIEYLREKPDKLTN